MERIRVNIDKENQVGATIHREGELLEFLTDGTAIVMITSKPNRGCFERVKLYEITAMDNNGSED